MMILSLNKQTKEAQCLWWTKLTTLKIGIVSFQTPNFTKKLECDPAKEISKQINETFSDMNSIKHIDDDTYDCIRPDAICTACRFYMLLKLHKEWIPGRPIVSANGHPTEKISEFVDYNLRPHVRTIPSFIQDTTDYLKNIDSLNTIPNNTILVSMDVSSLYTNIPKNEGVAACEQVWINIPNSLSDSVAETSARKQQFCIQRSALLADWRYHFWHLPLPTFSWRVSKTYPLECTIQAFVLVLLYW